ncbi:alkene reductase [Granulicella sp. S156]|uniref:alkene reductase n=1 Tax=Granulicella sp. S156 TaxID=1747224 RepID=UPI00131D8977|nr:alkene reductase [Granulicella sp. S156]
MSLDNSLHGKAGTGSVAQGGGSDRPLFTAYSLGDLPLANRVVMSPMTRGRTTNSGRVPTVVEARYYSQRASAGLIITGGIYVSPQAVGAINVPGLYTEEQVDGWKRITDAIHRRGSRIFAQIAHSGSISHPDLLNGASPVAPSAVNPLQKAFTPSGFADTVTPRELTLSEIQAVIDDFRVAAANAKRAGFDGVELHGAAIYLIPQFLNEATNLRTDAYGGTVENRSRLLLEILSALADVWAHSRIGIKLSPSLNGLGVFRATETTVPTYEYIVKHLAAFQPAYLHLMRPINDLSGTPVALLQQHTLDHFRSMFPGTIIGNVGFDSESANEAIRNGNADLISFARHYISNPDLVERLRHGYALATSDPTTYFQGGSTGYIDYTHY